MWMWPFWCGTHSRQSFFSRRVTCVCVALFVSLKFGLCWCLCWNTVREKHCSFAEVVQQNGTVTANKFAWWLHTVAYAYSAAISRILLLLATLVPKLGAGLFSIRRSSSIPPTGMLAIVRWAFVLRSFAECLPVRSSILQSI
jgi:hypothetical protein